MPKRAGDPNPDPPGGRARRRLEEFEAAREPQEPKKKAVKPKKTAVKPKKATPGAHGTGRGTARPDGADQDTSRAHHA